MLQEPTLQELERALDDTVSALVAYRVSPPSRARKSGEAEQAVFSAISLSDLCVTDLNVLKARDLVSAPVEQGLKKSIKELGKLIHASVGDGGMVEVAERVCSLDDANWQRRMSPIDSAWDGIGSWHS